MEIQVEKQLHNLRGIPIVDELGKELSLGKQLAFLLESSVILPGDKVLVAIRLAEKLREGKGMVEVSEVENETLKLIVRKTPNLPAWLIGTLDFLLWADEMSDSDRLLFEKEKK